MSDIFSPRIGVRHEDGTLALRAHPATFARPGKEKVDETHQMLENLLVLQLLAKVKEFLRQRHEARLSSMTGNGFKTKCLTVAASRLRRSRL